MGAIAPSTAAGTMPVVLFTEACMSITRSRLLSVLQYNQASAIYNPVT
jgi:hypothetical protein